MLFKEKCTESQWGQRLLREYDYQYNQSVLGIDFDKLTCGSGKKVRWICEECGSVLFLPINGRLGGRGCFTCTKRKAMEQRIKNCIKKNGSLYDWAMRHGELGQKLIREFDTEENEKEGIKMDELTSKSSKKIHWICDKGHKWQVAVYCRTAARSSGCPYCCLRGRFKRKE